VQAPRREVLGRVAAVGLLGDVVVRARAARRAGPALIGIVDAALGAAHRIVAALRAAAWIVQLGRGLRVGVQHGRAPPCSAAGAIAAPAGGDGNKRNRRGSAIATHAAHPRNTMIRPAFLTPFLTLFCGLMLCIGRPSHAAPDVGADIAMAAEAQPMRAAAELFIARAAAGDRTGASAMLSHALVQRIGETAVQQAMQNQIVPFFARGGAVGRSATVTRTTDAAGQRGYAFYLWWVRGADARPFTVYVVDEAGTARIANVVPDRMVAERHR
jgi:hypothetical protein